MNIAFICKNNIKERYANILSLLKNMEALEELGYPTTLLIPRRGWSTEEAYHYLNDACLFYNVRISPTIILVPSTTKHFGRSFGIFASFLGLFKKFELIWSRDIYGANTAARLGLRTIFEHHTQLSPKAQKLIKGIQDKSSFRGVIAISNAHRELLIGYGLRSDKIMVAHSGIEKWVLEKKSDTTLRKEASPTIVYAGSFYTGRGLETILKIAGYCPEYRFICIGGTSEQIEFYKSASSHLKNIRFIEKLSRPDLLPYLQAATVLMAPYTHESQSVSGDNIALYQSPLKLIEYMALGKPIVTSYLGAIPEIITDRHNGLLVEPDDTQSYVEAINLLVNNSELAIKIGRNARQDAAQYTWEQRVANTLAFVMQ